MADRPRGKAKICEAEPIRVIKEIKAVRIYKGELATYSPREDVCSWLEGKETQETPPTRTGGYVYDFGENNAGIFRLKIRGRAGQRIDIQCTEYLDGDKPDYGNFNFYPDGYVQRDIYILHSDEEEIFEPMFTYHGFRYIYISGITEEQADDDLLTYLVMSSDLEETGGFECSDDIANKIFEIARRSDRANFYYFPTDCPHREKNGWTGDASVSSEHMIMTMNTEKSWREWLNNIGSLSILTAVFLVLYLPIRGDMNGETVLYGTAYCLIYRICCTSIGAIWYRKGKCSCYDVLSGIYMQAKR